MKRLLLIIIDALSSEYCVPAIKNGELPNFKALTDHGYLIEESVSVFPSLTPAATSTIATGAYPIDHGIFGFHWYDREKDEVAYYGDDFWVVAKMGFADFFDGCIRRLNSDRLTSETLYEKVEKQPKMKSAAFNFLIFKGPVEQVARIPIWFSWHPKVPFSKDVSGPTDLFFGDMIDSKSELAEESPEREGGLLGRFGFNDENTSRLLLHYAENDLFPELTVAYFPDHDWAAHESGLDTAQNKVKAVDEVLGKFFQAYGGVESALEKFHVVVSGDHAQTDVLDDEEEAAILLDQVLSRFDISDAGGWNGDNLKVCPDMRAAQIYFREYDDLLVESVIKELLGDKRVDQVLKRERGEHSFAVFTGDRGTLRFKAVDPKDAMARDLFGGAWSWEGDLSTLDAKVSDGVLDFGVYPNAFERIAGGLEHRNSGDLWATARLGYEFATGETSIHLGGGSHGSLHALDSLSPIIVGGTKERFGMEERARLVDIAPLCARLLGLESRPLSAPALNLSSRIHPA